MTAFGTTAGQYFTAVLGSHTSTETVSALALQVTGLESSFHDTTALNSYATGRAGLPEPVPRKKEAQFYG